MFRLALLAVGRLTLGGVVGVADLGRVVIVGAVTGEQEAASGDLEAVSRDKEAESGEQDTVPGEKKDAESGRCIRNQGAGARSTVPQHQDNFA